MNNARDRLLWLIHFAQTDTRSAEQFPELAQAGVIDELKDWEWMKLKQELLEFIGLEEEGPFRFEFKSHKEIEDAHREEELTRQVLNPEVSSAKKQLAFRELDEISQKKIKTAKQIVAGKITSTPDGEVTKRLIRKLSMEAYGSLAMITPAGFRVGFEKGETLIEQKPTGNIFVSFRTIDIAFEPGEKIFTVRGSIEELFNVRVFLLLQQEGTDAIQNCPECKAIFLRIGKQKYCSKTCINRVSRRKWLEKPKNLKKEKAWARERYQRRVKKKTNGNVRVQSRERKGKEKE